MDGIGLLELGIGIGAVLAGALGKSGLDRYKRRNGFDVTSVVGAINGVRDGVAKEAQDTRAALGTLTEAIKSMEKEAIGAHAVLLDRSGGRPTA